MSIAHFGAHMFHNPKVKAVAVSAATAAAGSTAAALGGGTAVVGGATVIATGAAIIGTVAPIAVAGYGLYKLGKWIFK